MSQELNEEYIEDFLYGNEPTSVYFKGAYDYYHGHATTLKYEYDARKRHYLYRMMPSNGFKINSTISYEKNNIFEKFRINEDFGSFVPYLASHDTWRVIIDANKYWRIDTNQGKNFISIKNNIVYNYLSNDDVNDFVYFFGGGLTGLKGYTYYEPTLQGPELFMLNNEVSMKLFSDKSYGLEIFSLSAASIGFISQIGKANNSRIISPYWSLKDECSDSEAINYNAACENFFSEWSNIEFDALDKNNNIPDEYEGYVIVNVYGDNLENEETMQDLKNRYNRFKQTFGISFKVFGFSFYSYPTALSYEWHIPYKDPMNNQGRHYLKVLFDF